MLGRRFGAACDENFDGGTRKQIPCRRSREHVEVSKTGREYRAH